MTRPLATALALTVAAVATAAPQSFARQFQAIRAGCVVLDGDRNAGAPDAQGSAPYAWFNLSRLVKTRPAEWNVINPFAPSLYSSDEALRWNRLNALNTGATGNPVVTDGKVNKANAHYWEVKISQLEEEQLASYDVLLVSPTVFLGLNSNEREKLRRFMDRGGVLWAELGFVGPGRVDAVNNLPLTVNLRADVGANRTAFFPNTPLTTRPNTLSFGDQSRLAAGLDATITGLDTSIPLLDYYRPLQNDFTNLQWEGFAQYGGNYRPFVASARVGDGTLVVSSSRIAQALSGGASNTAYRADETTPPTPAMISAAKFAANVISLANVSRQPGAGARRNSSSLADITGPLLQRFRVERPTGGRFPAVYGGLAATTFPDGTIAVYDIDPSRDLDGDGDPDDGIYTTAGTVDDTLRDYSLGKPGDLVWSVNVGGGISSPVIAPVSVGGVATPYLFVTDQQGALRRFRLDLRTGANFLMGSTADHSAGVQSPPSAGGYASPDSIIPPTVHDGIVYVVDKLPNADPEARSARVLLYEAATGAPRGVIGDPAQGYQPLGSPTGIPTVGYIPVQDNSGGMDKVMYLPFAAVKNSQNTAGFSSLWLGARGEKPFALDPNPDTADTGAALQVTTRAAQANPALPIDVSTVRLTMQDALGNPLTANRMSDIFDGVPDVTNEGEIRFPFRAGVTRLPAGTTVRVDYGIDFTATSPAATGVVRGELRLPDSTTQGRRVIGALALTPRGTIVTVFGAGTEGQGGALYSIREEGRGQFRMLSRYELFDAFNMPLSGAPAQRVDEVFFDKDPVNQFLYPGGPPPYSDPRRRLRSFAFQTGPAVQGDRAYVVATARKVTGFAPVPITSSYLMCFDAEPAVPEIRVGALADNSVIVQPDIARSITKANPDVSSFLGVGVTNYDADRGVLRLENLAANPRGVVNNALSRSQPIILRTPNQPDRVIQPDAQGTKWSPLRWFTFLPAMAQESGSQPFVAGGTVYVAGSSVFPSLINGGGLVPAAYVNSFDAVIAPNDPFLRATDENRSSALPFRAWQKQLMGLETSGGNLVGSPHVRWPSYAGIASDSDFRVRVNQTVMRGSLKAYGVVAAEGTVLGVGDNALHGFQRSDLLIADQGRLGTYDATGTALTVLDGGVTLGEGDDVGAGRVSNYIRPARAYSVGEADLLVTDPSSDKVAVVDENGVESRTITTFRVDPAHLPAGWRAGESTKLEGPRDAILSTSYVTDVSTATTDDDIVSGQRPYEFWRRYLIADTGNRRLVEVSDRFVADGNGTVGALIQRGVLTWHSPAEIAGKRYAYTSVARVYLPTQNGTRGRFVYVAGVSNGSPGSIAVGRDRTDTVDQPRRDDRSSGGGVVVFDSANTDGPYAILGMSIPDTSASENWNGSTWVAPAAQSVEWARRRAHVKYLQGVNAVTARVEYSDTGITIPGVNPGDAPRPYVESASGFIRVMLSTDDGVYELPLPTVINKFDIAPVAWMLTRQAYGDLRHVANFGPSSDTPLNFRPAYARRLDDGDVIVVNGYAGLDRANRPFQGEVVQIDGTVFNPAARNLGFDASTLRLRIARISGTRGLLNPTFADRR